MKLFKCCASPAFLEHSIPYYSSQKVPSMPYPLHRTSGTSSSSRSRTSEQEENPCPDVKHFLKRNPIRFDPQIIIHSVPHSKDYSEEEAANSWYSKKEIRQMKQDSRMEAKETPVDDISNQLPGSMTMSISDEMLDSRGLESKTPAGAMRKRKHRLEAWTLVFSRQQSQTQQGAMDPEALADAYFDITEICRIQAYLVALKDAREVEWMKLLDGRQRQKEPKSVTSKPKGTKVIKTRCSTSVLQPNHPKGSVVLRTLV